MAVVTAAAAADAWEPLVVVALVSKGKVLPGWGSGGSVEVEAKEEREEAAN